MIWGGGILQDQAALRFGADSGELRAEVGDGMKG